MDIVSPLLLLETEQIMPFIIAVGGAIFFACSPKFIRIVII